MALYALTGRKPLVAVPHALPQAEPPLVSVLVPARNEAGRVLASSIRSILLQDYDCLEVIAVNDRSTDTTSRVLHAIAATHPRLRVIDGAEPPAGWLGKPYALQQALEASRGVWVLTVDADMVLSKDAVRAAVGRAQAGGFDVLTVIPHLEAKTFWERLFTPAWVLVLMGAAAFANLAHPRVKPAVAFGGFMLMRRDALTRLGGFVAVRADLVEDVRLGQLLKASSARYHVEHAPNLVRTRMQEDFRDIWTFLSRVMFASMRYSLVLSSLYSLTGLVFVVAPPILAAVCLLMTLWTGSAAEWSRPLFAPCLIVWGTQVAILLAGCRRFGIPVRYALTTPLGLSLFYVALLVAAMDVVRGRGVRWKERIVYRRGGLEPRSGRPGS